MDAIHEDSEGYMDDPNLSFCCCCHPKTAFKIVGIYTIAGFFGVLIDIIIYVIFYYMVENERWTVKPFDHIHEPVIKSFDNKYYMHPSFMG